MNESESEVDENEYMSILINRSKDQSTTSIPYADINVLQALLTQKIILVDLIKLGMYENFSILASALEYMPNLKSLHILRSYNENKTCKDIAATIERCRIPLEEFSGNVDDLHLMIRIPTLRRIISDKDLTEDESIKIVKACQINKQLHHISLRIYWTVYQPYFQCLMDMPSLLSMEFFDKFTINKLGCVDHFWNFWKQNTTIRHVIVFSNVWTKSLRQLHPVDILVDVLRFGERPNVLSLQDSVEYKAKIASQHSWQQVVFAMKFCAVNHNHPFAHAVFQPELRHLHLQLADAYQQVVDLKKCVRRDDCLLPPRSVLPPMLSSSRVMKIVELFKNTKHD